MGQNERREQESAGSPFFATSLSVKNLCVKSVWVALSVEELSLHYNLHKLPELLDKIKQRRKLQKHVTCFYSPQKRAFQNPPRFPSFIVPQNNPSHFT